jgi:hypothetical protein
MKIPVIRLAMMWMRRLLAAACFFALLWGGIRPVLAPFWGGGSPFPTIGERLRSERSELRCFAEGVFERTPQRAAVLFLVPPDDSDGGLVNHRLRYVLPGRQILTSGDAPFIATWHRPPSGARVIWTGCGGTLVQR